MNKAVFLDRDGTINVEKNYLYRIDDFEFLPGVIDGLRLLQNTGFLLVIITNQSGIGRGYYSEEDFHTLNEWMLNTLDEQGVHVAKTYYCPHLPDAAVERYRQNCNCRKPRHGMYEQAIREFDIDVSRSYAIGDKIRDCAICNTYDCKGYLIGDHEKEDIVRNVQEHHYQNVQWAENLYDAARSIVAEGAI